MVTPPIVAGDRLPARPPAASGTPIGLSLGLHGLALALALTAGFEGNALQGDNALLIELDLGPSTAAGGAPTTASDPPGEPPPDAPEPEVQQAAATEPPLAPPVQAEATIDLPLPDVPPPPEIPPPPPDPTVELAPAEEPPPLDTAQLKPVEPPPPPPAPPPPTRETKRPPPAEAKPAAKPAPRDDRAPASAAPPGARPPALQEGAGTSARQSLAGFLPAAPIVFEGKPRFRHPPTPAVYPSRALELGQQGEVLVRVRLDPTGAAVEILVTRSSGFDLLDRAALAAVRGWHFLPAVRDGRAVAAWVEIPVRFHLR